MERIDCKKVSKKFLKNCQEVEFINSDFEIIDDTNEEITLESLTINNDVDLDYSFKAMKIKVRVLVINNIKIPDLKTIKNLSKHIDFEQLILFNREIFGENFYYRSGKDYASRVLYYLYIQDLPLDHVLINDCHQSIKTVSETFRDDIFDTDENSYFYGVLVFSQNLKKIKGTCIVAGAVTFLSDDFVIEDDIRFKDLKYFTVNNNLDLDKAFGNLKNKIENIYVNDFMSDINNTGLNFEEFINMLKETNIPVDKCKFRVNDVKNSKMEIDCETLVRYNGDEKELHLPDGIKYINYNAFSGEITLDVLYIPSTLEVNGGIFNSNIKKIVCANNCHFKNRSDLGHSWLVLSDKTLIKMSDIKHLKYNKVLEINVLEDIDNLIKFINSLEYDNESPNYLEKIIINNFNKVNLSSKLILKNVFRDKFNKKIDVVFNIVERKSMENEYLDEETDDFVDKEIKDLIQKLESKKSLLKKEDQKNLSACIKKLLRQYVKDLKSLEPTLKSSLKGDINFGKKSPEELKLNLMISLNKLLTNFFRKDYEELIADLKKYQTILNSNSLSLKDDLSLENKINNILYIAHIFHFPVIKEKIKSLLDNTLAKAQEYYAKDMDDEIELVFQNYSNLNLEFNKDINELYENVLKYQEKMQPILDLYYDLDLNTGGEFSKELVKNFKERLESFHDDKVKLIMDLFNTTLDRYQAFLLGILNTFPIDENIDTEYIKSCIRYGLSPIEVYLINNSVTNITIYQITNSLRNGLKIIDNEDDVDNDYIANIILEIENKCLKFNSNDKDIMYKELKSILNKWLSFLNNGDFNSLKNKPRFKALELNILYLIIKDLVNLNISIDNYIENKNNYHKATKILIK